MALIGGIRLANALTSGNISGSCLETLLASPARCADLESLLQSSGYSCYLGTSNAASFALVNSNSSLDAIMTSNIGSCVLFSSPDFANNFANSTCSFQRLIADDNTFNKFSNSLTAISCALENQNSVFNTTVVQSNNYVCRIISNSTIRCCLFTNSGSVNALASNSNTAAALFSDPYLSCLFLCCGTSVCLAFNSPAWIDFGKDGNSTSFLRCCSIGFYAGKTPLSAICYLLDSCAANTLVNNSTCGYCRESGRMIPSCTLSYFVCGSGACGYPQCSSPYVLKCLNCLLACGANVPFLNEMLGVNRGQHNFGMLNFCHELMTKFANSCTCFYGGYCNANTDGLLAGNWWNFFVEKSNDMLCKICFFPTACCIKIDNRTPIGVQMYSLSQLEVCTANTTYAVPPLCDAPLSFCRPLTENEIRARISCGFERIVAGRSCFMTSANNGNFIMFGPGFRNCPFDRALGGRGVIACPSYNDCDIFYGGCNYCDNISESCGQFGVFSQHCCHCSLKTCGLLLCPMLYTKNAGRKWDVICVCIPSTIFNCRSCGTGGTGQGCGLQDHFTRHTGNCGYLSTCITSAFACENDIWVGFVIRPWGAPCTGEITGYVYGCVAANNDPVWLCWNADCGSIPSQSFTYCCGFFAGFGPGAILRCPNGNPNTCGPRSWTHNSSCNSGLYSYNFIIGKVNHTFAPQSINPCPPTNSMTSITQCAFNPEMCILHRWRWCGNSTTANCGLNCGWPCLCRYYPDYVQLESREHSYGPMTHGCQCCNVGLPSVKIAIMCCYSCCDRARVWAFNYDPSVMAAGISACCYNSSQMISVIGCIGVISADVCCGAVTFYNVSATPGCCILRCHPCTPIYSYPVAVFALANTLVYLSGEYGGYTGTMGTPPNPIQFASRSAKCCSCTCPIGDYFQGFDDNMSSCFGIFGCSDCGGIWVMPHCLGATSISDSCGSIMNCGCGLVGNQCAVLGGAGTIIDNIPQYSYPWSTDVYSGYRALAFRPNYTVINAEKCTFVSMWACPYGVCGRVNGAQHCAITTLVFPPNDFMANTCISTILLRGCSSHIKIGANSTTCFGQAAVGRHVRPLLYLGTGDDSSFCGTGSFGSGIDKDFNTDYWSMSCSGFSPCYLFGRDQYRRTGASVETSFCNFMPFPGMANECSGGGFFGIIGGYPNITCRLTLAISSAPCGQESIYCQDKTCFHHGLMPCRIPCAYAITRPKIFDSLGITCTCALQEYCGAGNYTYTRSENYIVQGPNNSPALYNFNLYPDSAFVSSSSRTTPNGMSCLVGGSGSAPTGTCWLTIRLTEAFVQLCGLC